MSSERFKVRVGNDHLIFCCAHFISYEGDKCEAIHGHNFRAAVELEGSLDENGYLFDFIALKRLAKAITDELDHHVLLATGNTYIKVVDGPEQVRVTYRDRHWVFPREDCILLPIENTTAEMLARLIGERLLPSLKAERNFAAQLLRVEVEEGVGQTAGWEWRSA